MSSSDAYWTEDIQIGAGTFQYYHSEPRPIWAQVHTSEERYELEPEEREIVPVTALRGTRTYVHAQVFAWEPDWRLSAVLSWQPGTSGSIGQVLGVEERGQRRQELGLAQAWYYAQDRLVVLWECFFNRFYRDAPLPEDANMAALWQGMERWLAGHFTEAQRIATPFRDPLFRDDAHQTFLRCLGYAPVAKAAFGKALQRER